MEDKAAVTIEPDAAPGVPLGGVIVVDNVDDLAGRNVGFDRIEKVNELRMAVTLHAAADHLPSSALSAPNKVVVPGRW